MSELPKQFDFYGLGEVRLFPANHASDEELFWIGFKVDGDESDPWLFCGFEAKLDRSMYTELANVIASRWAGAAGRMISPPTPVPDSWIAQLDHVEHEASLYRHFCGEDSIPIQVRIVQRFEKGVTS